MIIHKLARGYQPKNTQKPLKKDHSNWETDPGPKNDQKRPQKRPKTPKTRKTPKTVRAVSNNPPHP